MRHKGPTLVGRYTRVLATGVLGIALGATLLSACSSSPKTTPTAASAPGVTSNSITIGATVPLTGPAAPGYDEIAPAMDAVFDWVNAHGGVHGRKIHYTYLDDGYNPANTATLTRKLVLQDNIFADVGSLGTPTQSRGAELLEHPEGAATLHRVGVQLLERSRPIPRARDGSPRTPSKGRSSAPTSRPTSRERRSATCTRVTSSARTS